MALRVARLALKTLMWVVVLSIPALGVWLSSSLAAYAHGPDWLVSLAGTMLFPLLPLAFEYRAQRRKSQSPKAAAPGLIVLSVWDRLVLRTLCINLAFLVPLLYFFPKPSFRALATRGDWFLQHARPTLAAKIRPWLFSGVDRLSWIYGFTTRNPYERYQDQNQDPPPPPPDRTPKPETDQNPAEPGPSWPLPVGLHPIVTTIPPEALGDYPSVARYIGDKITQPRERIKALHDFVIWHLSYDYAALEGETRPDQHAAAVFASRKAVCAGYARLLSDMSKTLGLDVRYITGQVRDNQGRLADSGHAWNAVELDGQWHLVDATWNDQDHRKHPDPKALEGYRTTYFLAPPRAFLLEHFPKDPAWQLVTHPISLQDFLRQAQLEPEFLAAGMTLEDPALRAQIQVDQSRWSFAVNNPQKHKLFANIGQKAGEDQEAPAREPCQISGRELVTIDCPLSWDTSTVELYGGPANPNGSYPRIAQFEVHYR